MGCSDNSHSPPKWKNLSSIITSLSVHALRPVYISSLSLVHLYLSCVDGGSITVEVGLSNMRRQMNVHLFSFNIPFDGDSCFNSGASVAHLTPCFHIVVHGSWIAGCTPITTGGWRGLLIMMSLLPLISVSDLHFRSLAQIVHFSVHRHQTEVGRHYWVQ